MTKTTLRQSGALFMWLLMVSPAVLILVLKKKHPDLEAQMDRLFHEGPLSKLALFTGDHPTAVILPGALLVALSISNWRRTAQTSLGLLALVAVVSTVASLVVLARYGVIHGVPGLGRFWNLKLQWWLVGLPIVHW
ncbi:MAG: hypothetical protein EOP85_06600 [Verrucomicrobiaceae bacterium]|nr:MAG: hypothetical protein EOP85_06600 [Verrucomicrobiaceae bacterium]